MIFLFLGILYISVLCWTMGHMIISWTTNPRWRQSFVTQLIAGLCGYCFIAGCWSLLFSMANNGQHLVAIVFTVIYWIIRKPFSLFRSQLASYIHLKGPEKIVLAFSLILLLIMGSWEITHPDTLGYHAAIINWIKTYQVIPGLANLQLRLGYQGQWYPLCSFFSLQLQEPDTTNLLNLSVCCWFLAYIAEKVLHSQTLRKKISWILLLVLSFASYTQLRLTATSASPDFIAAILTWWVFYELFRYNHSLRDRLLVVLVCITAITIKLSTVIGGLFLLYWLFQDLRGRQWSKAVLLCTLSIILLLPFVTRNIITTGYLIFPLPQTGISYLSWTLPIEKVIHDHSYIKAYARNKTGYDLSEIQAENQKKLIVWLPQWWRHQSVADQIIIAASLIALFFAIAVHCKNWRKQTKQTYLLATLTAGIAFWTIQAPDPRFGFGYLIPLFAFFKWEGPGHNNPLHKLLYRSALVFVAAISGLYIGYRMFNYYTLHQTFIPKGINNPAYQTVTCNGTSWNQPVPLASGCMGLSAPCLPVACSSVNFRGDQISEGFLPAP